MLNWPATSTPSVFIIGRDGMILESAVGPRPWTEPAGRALLEALVRVGA